MHGKHGQGLGLMTPFLVAQEASLPSFEHFMASFLWSIGVQTMKKIYKTLVVLCSVAELSKLNKCALFVANRVIFMVYNFNDYSHEAISARELK